MADQSTTTGHVATVHAATAWEPSSLLAVLDQLAGAESVRVAVLDFTTPGTVPALGQELAAALALSALPTVAAVSGPIVGTAVELILDADIRIGDPTLQLTFRTFGTRRQLQLLGRDRAIRLFEAGGIVGAGLALELGLISEIAPAGEALGRAQALAATIASRGPIATRLAKEAIWRGLAMPLGEALRFETDLTLLLQTTKDRAEGVSAFIEKRAPIFTGN